MKLDPEVIRLYYIMVFSKNNTKNRKYRYVMKSIKTNPNSAKWPDKGKSVNNVYCIYY